MEKKMRKAKERGGKERRQTGVGRSRRGGTEEVDGGEGRWERGRREGGPGPQACGGCPGGGACGQMADSGTHRV